MNWPLLDKLPPRSEATPDLLLDRFLEFAAEKKLTLYPAQEEAILALLDGKNVILNTPTGSGKSLVALALHFQSLAQGRRSFYTCPIKALVNEKFRDLCALFGPDLVGMVTGDGSVNGKAPIICCTAEIVSNLALREGPTAQVDDVVMDEFHYYSDKQRGVAWQIPLLALPQTRFLLMSATLGDVAFFANAMTKLNGRATEVVRSNDRPVPLDFEYRETPLHETIADLVQKGLAPIYLVNFSQREAAEEAQNLLSVDFSSKEEKKKIQEALEGTKFQSPYGKDFQRLLRHGIGLHHAGLLPRYRVLVEKLAQQGLLKVISGTDTLGVGVNVPIRTVLFTKLSKYDGEKSGQLTVREFHQISGRAGRRGFDARGLVVAQAPEHVIENIRARAKAEKGGKKKEARSAPPGFVMWTNDTFQKLVAGTPEPLVSRFYLSHGMLLNVLSRPDGFKAMKALIRDSHGPANTKKALRKTAFELFRSLLDRKIVEFHWSAEHRHPQIRVPAALQEDFSLHQTLALYLIDTLAHLDAQAEDFALDALTLSESILENPELILRRQLDRVKNEKMAQMKADGVEYEQRIEELEKLEHPKPRREFIYDTFNIFREAHPWIGQEGIRPKSIAREMFENFHSFADYIREYDLHKVEGLLLRYLSEVYKVLEQTIPDTAKNEELRSMAVYFETMIRAVDSSLLEDWEKMRRGPLAVVEEAKSEAPKVRSDAELTRLARNEAHRFVRALATRDPEAVLAMLSDPPSKDAVEKFLKDYAAGHQRIRTDPKARGPGFTKIEKGPIWLVEQTLVDPEDHNDWFVALRMEFPLEGAPKITLDKWGPVGSV
ncbi:MAG: DEAD/DEAH box helicase [Bdellovibrionota bacterium]